MKEMMIKEDEGDEGSGASPCASMQSDSQSSESSESSEGSVVDWPTLACRNTSIYGVVMTFACQLITRAR